MVARRLETFRSGPRVAGFTLAEVVIAVVVLAVLMGGVIYGCLGSAERADWAARALAAQSLASQGAEQVRAARWDPQVWPMVDELPPTNFVRLEVLDIPNIGPAQYATNFISVINLSTDPPLRRIRADCVWRFYRRGLFTNTVIALRGPDQ